MLALVVGAADAGRRSIATGASRRGMNRGPTASRASATIGAVVCATTSRSCNGACRNRKVVTRDDERGFRVLSSPAACRLAVRAALLPPSGCARAGSAASYRPIKSTFAVREEFEWADEWV